MLCNITQHTQGRTAGAHTLAALIGYHRKMGVSGQEACRFSFRQLGAEDRSLVLVGRR